MTDNELRGAVLREFYDKRHAPTGPQVDLGALVPKGENEGNWVRTANICDQLGTLGLILWKKLPGPGGIPAAGIGSITAAGVDVIEGVKKVPSVAIDQSVHVHGSTGVQIGDSNKQGDIAAVNVDIGKLTAAIDHSQVGTAEKEKAKSLLAQLAENGVLKAALSAAGVLFSGGGAH